MKDQYIFRCYQYCSIGCTADSLIRQTECANSFVCAAGTFHYVTHDDRPPANVMSDENESSTFRHRRYQYCSIGCTADSLNRQSESMPQNVSYVPQWQISMYSDAISTVLLVVRLIAWSDSERICRKQFRMCAETLHYISSDDWPPANVMSDESESSTFRHRRYQYCSIGCTADSLSDTEKICREQSRMCAGTFHYVSSDERSPANVMSDGGGSSTFRHRRYQYCSIGCTADSLNRQSESMPQNVSYVPQWQISIVHGTENWNNSTVKSFLALQHCAWSEMRIGCRPV